MLVFVFYDHFEDVNLFGFGNSYFPMLSYMPKLSVESCFRLTMLLMSEHILRLPLSDIIIGVLILFFLC